MRCGDCRYAEELEVDGRNPVLACHRFPPSVVDVQIAQGDAGDEIAGLTMFPTVDMDDWCGEFAPDTEEPGFTLVGH